MTAVTAPRSRRSLIGTAIAAVQARAKTAGRYRKFAEVAAKARQHVVTVAALTSMDIGAFHGGPIAGWVVTGLSLLALDFAVTG